MLTKSRPGLKVPYMILGYTLFLLCFFILSEGNYADYWIVLSIEFSLIRDFPKRFMVSPALWLVLNSFLKAFSCLD